MRLRISGIKNGYAEDGIAHRQEEGSSDTCVKPVENLLPKESSLQIIMQKEPISILKIFYSTMLMDLVNELCQTTITVAPEL